MNPIKHVAIIMDGNGRWGIQNKGSRNLGHTSWIRYLLKNIIQGSPLNQKIKVFNTVHFFN